MENTGQVNESGSSTVKHALNPDKSFMQVHYLKVRYVYGKDWKKAGKDEKQIWERGREEEPNGIKLVEQIKQKKQIL